MCQVRSCIIYWVFCPAKMLCMSSRIQPIGRILLPSLMRPHLRKAHDVAEHFQIQRAIVGTLPYSFATQSLRFKEPEKAIDIENAKQQHSIYVNELKKLIPVVVQIPADERFPDSVYVEDPLVVHEGTALIAQMKPDSRAGEFSALLPVLEEMRLRIVKMSEPGAYLDGGDVMFTGREFLVGQSERTNAGGVEAIARAFPKWPVTAVTIKRGVLHLKSMSSIAGPDLIAIGDSEAGRIAWREIETKAHYKYRKLVFPDNNGANCVFINGVVLHPPKEEFPESFKVWETLDCPRVAVPNSEMAKADGSLTCNSVRIV